MPRIVGARELVEYGGWLPSRNCCAVVYSRMPASRWLDPMHNPCVHVGKARTQQGSIVDDVPKVLGSVLTFLPCGGDVCRRPHTETVLRASEVVNTGVWSRINVLHSIRVGVQ